MAKEAKRSGEHLVTIDRAFVRREAEDAIRQFFRPLTAPFEAVFSHRDDDVDVARHLAKIDTTRRRSR